MSKELSREITKIIKGWETLPTIKCNYCGVVFKGEDDCSYEQLKIRVQELEGIVKHVMKAIDNTEAVRVEDINAKQLYKIVTKLIGSIEPAGSTHIDSDRMKNLDTHIELVDLLLTDLYSLTGSRNDHRISVKDLGNEAYKYLRNEYEMLREFMEDLE